MKKALAILLACFALTAAASEELPTCHCPKITQAPKIDGHLSDAVWASVPETTPFKVATTGEPSKFKTVAKVCWDDENIYTSFYAEDHAIWGTLTERDSEIFFEEVVEIFLQPDPESFDYFEFEVSPRNTCFDAFLECATEGSKAKGKHDWNCEGFQSAVFVEGTAEEKSEKDKYWQVEMAIPFKSLERSTPVAGETWRANLYRIELCEIEEFQAWSPTRTRSPNFHIKSKFGNLVFDVPGS